MASFSKVTSTSPMSRCGEGRGGAAAAAVEHRHVGEQLGRRTRAPARRVPRLLQRVAPGRQVGVAAVAGGLGVRHDHLQAGLDQIVPVLDALGVALAHQEHGGRGVGRGVVREALAPVGGHQAARSTRKSMSGAWFMVTTSASSPSATACACLLEPPCDWLIGDRLAGLGLPVGDEGRVDVLVELARDVVGHVEDRGVRAKPRLMRRRSRQP